MKARLSTLVMQFGVIGSLAGISIGLMWARDMMNSEKLMLAALQRLEAKTASMPIESSTRQDPLPSRCSQPATIAPPPARAEDAEPLPQAARDVGVQPVSQPEFEARLKAGFQQERIDRSWAVEAQGLIRTGIESVLGDTSAMTSVQCRSANCLIQLTLADEASYQELVEVLFSPGPGQLWNAGWTAPRIRVLPDGRLDAEIYLGREEE